jgi:hypothetical protein
MALIESGLTPLARASGRHPIMPGEFQRRAGAHHRRAAVQSEELLEAWTAPTPLEEAVPRVVRIAATMRRFTQAKPWIDERIAEARGEFPPAPGGRLAAHAAPAHRLLEHRPGCRRHRAAAAPVGGPARPPAAPGVITIVHEIEWRLRALERESLLRSGLLDPAEDAVMLRVVGRLKGEARPAVAPTPDRTQTEA